MKKKLISIITAIAVFLGSFVHAFAVVDVISVISAAALKYLSDKIIEYITTQVEEYVENAAQQAFAAGLTVSISR